MDSLIGTTLAHFQITESLGAGGMGVVYGAHDTKLDRNVALKILPETLAADPDRLQRFKREARLLAALNHPNIGRIYGIEEQPSGTPFLVLERLDGESLASLLDSGPLPLSEALRIARSIALALDAAHEKGIVHRDLKPGNVMVSPSGVVKVLDFGLARSMSPQSSTTDIAGNATTRTHFTQTLHDHIVGSPGYMSPEQIRVGGEDERTDIFAFGCVLFESVTGMRAFPGANPAEETAAILYRDPDWAALPSQTPPKLRDLLRSCLEKDPERRLREMAEARGEVDALLSGRPAAFVVEHAEGSPKRHNLPLQLSSFIGRRREITACLGHMDESRLVTLTGVGGCGKSRLMLRVAEGLTDQYPDGIWFVDLAPFSDPARLNAMLAAALDLRETPGQSLAQTVTTHLRERRALILFDNCEHMLAAMANQATDLLHECKSLSILATSREAMHIEGERVYPVPPLSLPGPTADHRAVARSESARLFVERSALVRPGFALDEKSAPIVAEICRRLDGIPLALELAAARMRSLGIGEIRTRLDQRLRLLTGGSRTGMSRHQTLRATIQWSHDLLSAREQCLLRDLSVFAGGFSAEAAAAIVGKEIDESEVRDLLLALVEKSLVSLEPVPAPEPRFRFLETVKQYALEKLQEANEVEMCRDLHLGYMRQFVEKAEPELIGPNQDEWFQRLEMEHENLLAALEWCETAEGGAGMALQMAGSLWRFWWYGGRFSIGQSAIRKALALDRGAAPTPERAQALYGAAQMARELGQYSEARELFLQSLEVAEILGDPARIARAYNGLGNTAEYAGDYDAARSYHERSLHLSRKIGHQRGVAIDLHNLGIVLMIQKDFRGAAPLYEEALSIFREVGDINGAQATVTNLATIATEMGRHEAACEYFAESFRLAEGLPSQTLTADSLESFAVLAVKMGAVDLAARILSTADAVRKATGYTLSVENRGVVEGTVSRVRRELGEDRHAALDAEGRAMSFELAVQSVRQWLSEKTAARTS